MTQRDGSVIPDSSEWEITIEHDGLWPLRWSWRVVNTRWEDGHCHVSSRTGEARTKDRAQEKAAHGRLSIEREDFHLVEAE